VSSSLTLAAVRAEVYLSTTQLAAAPSGWRG